MHRAKLFSDLIVLWHIMDCWNVWNLKNKFLFHFCNSSHSTNENLPYLLSIFYVWNQWKKKSCNQPQTSEPSTLLHRCRISIKSKIQIDFSVHNVSSPYVPQYTHMKKEAHLAYWLGYGLDDQRVWVWFPTWARDFSFLHNVQTGSGAHLSSYTKGTGDCFWGGKAERVWSWPLTPSSPKVKNGGSSSLFLHMFSWHGA
jgi:hypothetical protein